MARRYLTGPEIRLLRDVYKQTLRYEAIRCDMADVNAKAITPAGVAYFSKPNYCDDFSKGTPFKRWLFVHEMMHVWQWGHHIWPVNAAVCLWIKFGGIYEKAYPYDLTPGKTLTAYNIEQQASIVADYWGLLTNTTNPRDNNNFEATLSDYTAVIAD